MKKLILTFVAIAFVSRLALQVKLLRSNKRRAVKTGPPNGLFSPAIITGDLVFTSGQIGIDSKTGQFAEGGIEATIPTGVQESHGGAGSFRKQRRSHPEGDCVSGGHERLQRDERTLSKQFKGDPPARTTVQVARLPRDARIEIEAVAVLK